MGGEVLISKTLPKGSKRSKNKYTNGTLRTIEEDRKKTVSSNKRCYIDCYNEDNCISNPMYQRM